jgi:hypothetical protein
MGGAIKDAKQNWDAAPWEKWIMPGAAITNMTPQQANKRWGLTPEKPDTDTDPSLTFVNGTQQATSMSLLGKSQSSKTPFGDMSSLMTSKKTLLGE